jgi:hypothetical protein
MATSFRLKLRHFGLSRNPEAEARMPFDLGDDTARARPVCGLIMESRMRNEMTR